jgi:hypothetical protein
MEIEKMADITCDICKTELIVENSEFLSGDIEQDLRTMLEFYSIEEIAQALKKWANDRLPSSFPRKYDKNRIPQF